MFHDKISHHFVKSNFFSTSHSNQLFFLFFKKKKKVNRLTALEVDKDISRRPAGSKSSRQIMINSFYLLMTGWRLGSLQLRTSLTTTMLLQGGRGSVPSRNSWISVTTMSWTGFFSLHLIIIKFFSKIVPTFHPCSLCSEITSNMSDSRQRGLGPWKLFVSYYVLPGDLYGGP